MCGIWGFSNVPVRKRYELSRMLSMLNTLRGTDASGIATVRGGRIACYKAPMPGHTLGDSRAFRDISKGTLVIGHTRLATCGLPSDNRNNHPQVSPSRKVALVHNGMIHNKSDLGNKLSKAARAEVDTEALLWAFAKFPPLKARDLLASHAIGTWALGILSTGPPTLYLTRNGEPLSYATGVSTSGPWIVFSSTAKDLSMALQYAGLPDDTNTCAEEGALYRIIPGQIPTVDLLAENLLRKMSYRHFPAVQGYFGAGWGAGWKLGGDNGDEWAHVAEWERYVNHLTDGERER